jgi:choline dehydrogenase-like flavoprotein
MSPRYDVVVGSGAGGGVVAGELAERGRSVLLLECGPHKTAADYMRWEARATHEMYWPLAFAEPPRSDQAPLIMFRGRCVGGTTSVNTKVALRPSQEDYEKWHAAAGLLGEVASRSPRRTCCPTSSAWSGGSASASAPIGNSACAPSFLVLRRWAPSSSR